MHDPWTQDFNRGYEWFLLQQAKARNPAIYTYGLPWVRDRARPACAPTPASAARPHPRPHARRPSRAGCPAPPACPTAAATPTPSLKRRRPTSCPGCRAPRPSTTWTWTTLAPGFVGCDPSSSSPHTHLTRAPPHWPPLITKPPFKRMRGATTRRTWRPCAAPWTRPALPPPS